MSLNALFIMPQKQKRRDIFRRKMLSFFGFGQIGQTKGKQGKRNHEIKKWQEEVRGTLLAAIRGAGKGLGNDGEMDVAGASFRGQMVRDDAIGEQHIPRGAFRCR